jgi:hypothetical protein
MMVAMRPARLTVVQVREHLRVYDPPTRRLAMEVRRAILRAAPEAAEKIAFHCLCYYLPESIWGVIGGNIAMISPEDECVMVGFIHGAAMDDPNHLLIGKTKHKRHCRIGSVEEARSAGFAGLIREAVRQARKASLR